VATVSTTVAVIHASSELYGSDRVVLRSVAGLDRERYEALVVLPRPGPLVERLRALDVEVCLAPVLGVTRPERRNPLRWLAGAPGALSGLDRALRGREVALVHSHTLAAWGGGLWARRRGVPHLWHVHELAPPWARRLLSRMVAETSARVICNSQATREALVGGAPALAFRSEVRHPYVEVAPSAERRESDPSLRVAWGFEPQDLVVAVVGRLSPRKGQLLALEAFERAAVEGSRLLLVGDPAPGHEGYEGVLRARIARSPRWRHVRRLPFQEQILPLLAACDLALVPSQEPEGFGLVAAEAQAVGCPVLASRLGGLAEVVAHEETGLLLPHGDSGAWSAAVQRVLGDPDLRTRWGTAGPERARGLNGSPAWVADVYDSLLRPA
jgi:glycosyltransferase involved in cell wall biosynthesis